MSERRESASLALVLAVTVLVQIMITFAATVPAVVAPLVSRDVGVAPEALGVFMMLAGVVSMLASPFVGGFIHRVGAFRINQAGVLLIALSMLAGAGGTLPLLLLCAVLLGAGATTAMPSAAHLLARVTPPNRLSVVMSIRQAGVPLGAAFAGLAVPALLLVMHWRTGLLLIGALILAAALMESPLRSRIEGGHAIGPAAIGTGGLIPLMRAIVTQPILRALTLCSMSYTFGQCALLVFLVSYLHIELGYSLASAGAVMALSQAMALGARLFWGWFADRSGESFKLLARLGAASAILCATAGFFTPAWPVWLVCVVVAALGATLTGWNGVFAGALVRNSPPGSAGAYMGASNFFGYFGVLSGPLLGALLIAWTGTYASVFFMAMAAIVPAAWQVRIAGQAMARAAQSVQTAPK